MSSWPKDAISYFYKDVSFPWEIVGKDHGLGTRSRLPLKKRNGDFNLLVISLFLLSVGIWFYLDAPSPITFNSQCTALLQSDPPPLSTLSSLPSKLDALLACKLQRHIVGDTSVMLKNSDTLFLTDYFKLFFQES